MSRRSEARNFDPPQTWYWIYRGGPSITEVANVIRQTRTLAYVKYATQARPVTYQRTDIFPTREEAKSALRAAVLRELEDAERHAAYIRDKLAQVDAL